MNSTINELTEQKEYFRPMAIESEQKELGIQIYPKVEPASRLNGLIQEAWTWLANNPQEDDAIRRRTAHYLLNYQRASQVEVAAGLISDLPEGTNLAGMNTHTVQLAKRCSKIYSLEAIKNENSDLFPLQYRIWRCLAECSEIFDSAEFTGHFEEGKRDRLKKFDRWKAISKLMLEKKSPMLASLALRLDERADLLACRYKFTRNAYFGYQVEGKAENLDKFSKEFSSYFLFNELRKEPEKLWISQDSFANPQFVRLMDWLQRKCKGILKFSLLPQDKIKEIAPRKYGYLGYDWSEAIDCVIKNACILDPVEKVFSDRILDNPEADITRLMELAFGVPYKYDTTFDPDKEEAKRQEFFRSLLPKGTISSFEWRNAHPGKDLYYIAFDFLVSNDELRSLDVNTIPGRKFIVDWITKNMPEIRLVPFYLGKKGEKEGCFYVLSPYKGQILLEGPEKVIREFDNKWSDEEGYSLDPRWQLYLIKGDTNDGKS